MRLREKTAAQSRELSRDLAVCGLFAALITVGAFIRVVIPAGADTMNFTLQWFFVLLAGLLLGSRRAFLSVAAYLLIGLLGVQAAGPLADLLMFAVALPMVLRFFKKYA